MVAGFDGNRYEGLDEMDEMDEMDARWEYIAWDVPSEYFGDVVGELNRTGWQIVGSEELDEYLQPAAGVMQRIHAKRQITQDWSWERTRQRWG